MVSKTAPVSQSALSQRYPTLYQSTLRQQLQQNIGFLDQYEIAQNGSGPDILIKYKKNSHRCDLRRKKFTPKSVYILAKLKLQQIVVNYKVYF